MTSATQSSATDVLGALGAVEMFEALSTDELSQMVEAGAIAQLGAGEVLFHPDDPSEHMHVVLRGAIEIIRPTPEHTEPMPVAYISPGEVIGDMAMLTGAARRSGARIPEMAELWTISRAAFEDLVKGFPDYGLGVARIFAQRLEKFIKGMRLQRSKELSGHLMYFDMPTVVQTLVSSSQTGVLSIACGSGDTFAEVLLIQGQIERARCGPLEGEEAFYEIFLGPDDGEFSFRTAVEPSADAISSVPISNTAMGLLMEAMRLVDELPGLRSRLDDGDKTHQASVSPPMIEWDDPSTEPIAKQLLAELTTPRRLSELTGDLPCSTFTFYRIAAKLAETEQIA